MNELTLYHNPRCSKSRAALALLEAEGLQPRLRLYLQDPLDKAEVHTLLSRLQLPVRELLRSGEEAYKVLDLGRPGLDDEALIEALVSEPKLLQRPIAVLGADAVIGRPPERVLELLA